MSYLHLHVHPSSWQLILLMWTWHFWVQLKSVYPYIRLTIKYTEFSSILRHMISHDSLCHSHTYTYLLLRMIIIHIKYNFSRIYPEVMFHVFYWQLSFLSKYVSEWITGDNSLISTWAPEELSNFISLRMQLAFEGKYQEIQNRPQDAVVYHSVQKVIQRV